MNKKTDEDLQIKVLSGRVDQIQQVIEANNLFA
jgi:hypothetical protein